MLLAELDAVGWSAIVTAICLGVGGIITSVLNLVLGYLDRIRAEKREEARLLREAEAEKKVVVIEKKLDDNTELTKEGKVAAAESAKEAKVAAATITEKTDVIVSQTNGPVGHLAGEVQRLNERVKELEAYNRESAHRIYNGLHELSLALAKIEVRSEVAQRQAKPEPPPT